MPTYKGKEAKKRRERNMGHQKFGIPLIDGQHRVGYRL